MTRQRDFVVEDSVQIPQGIVTLDDFHAWVASDGFPETGRIDFVAGTVEVEMAEDLRTHSPVKTAVAGIFFDLIVKPDRGALFIDAARVVCREAGLSVQPDLVVALWESVESGKVRYGAVVPGGRIIALHGAPDLVVEIASDSSVRKDTRVLPARYAQAGVPELWLADARGSDLRFEVRTLRAGRYEVVQPDAEGWLVSPCMGCSFRLLRSPARHVQWRYVLEQRSS